MSLDQTRPNYTINSKLERPTPLRIISQLFDYYKGREYSLVNLCRKFNATDKQIADALGIDRTLVSRQYPRGGKK